MKSKINFLVILMWSTVGHASAPAPVTKSISQQDMGLGESLFARKYHLTKKEFDHADPNFAKIVAMYKDLQSLAVEDSAKQAQVNVIAELIKNDAADYILNIIEGSFEPFADVDIKDLKFFEEMHLYEYFMLTAHSLQNAVKVALVMNDFYKTDGQVVSFEKQHKLNSKIVNRMADVVTFFDNFLNELHLLTKYNTGAYPFLNRMIDTWDDLGKQFVLAGMVLTMHSHASLKNENVWTRYEKDEQEMYQNTESAWDVFRRIAKDKLTENVSGEKVDENINERIRLFDEQGVKYISLAIESIVEMYYNDNDYVPNNMAEFEHNKLLVDQLFDYMESFIEELKNIKENYATPGEKSIAKKFASISREIGENIDKIGSFVPENIPISNGVWGNLLIHISQRLAQAKEKLLQPQLVQFNVEVLKELAKRQAEISLLAQQPVQTQSISQQAMPVVKKASTAKQVLAQVESDIVRARNAFASSAANGKQYFDEGVRLLERAIKNINTLATNYRQFIWDKYGDTFKAIFISADQFINDDYADIKSNISRDLADSFNVMTENWERVIYQFNNISPLKINNSYDELREELEEKLS